MLTSFYISIASSSYRHAQSSFYKWGIFVFAYLFVISKLCHIFTVHMSICVSILSYILPAFIYDHVSLSSCLICFSVLCIYQLFVVWPNLVSGSAVPARPASNETCHESQTKTSWSVRIPFMNSLASFFPGASTMTKTARYGSFAKLNLAFVRHSIVR